MNGWWMNGLVEEEKKTVRYFGQGIYIGKKFVFILFENVQKSITQKFISLAHKNFQ